jgi:hypothetical protein
MGWGTKGKAQKLLLAKSQAETISTSVTSRGQIAGVVAALLAVHTRSAPTRRAGTRRHRTLTAFFAGLVKFGALVRLSFGTGLWPMVQGSQVIRLRGRRPTTLQQ